MKHPHIIQLLETDSTNSFAIELLNSSKPLDGTVITTYSQTHGKGTDLNKWESETGKNLTFSIIFYPSFSAEKQFLFNKAISVAIFDFLKSELPNHSISIKWPNDIYVGDKKICGILIQNSISGKNLDYIVVGIGLNVNQEIFISNAPNPVSMKLISGKTYDLSEMLHSLYQCIAIRYSEINSGLCNQIESDYQSSLYKLQQWGEYYLHGKLIKARIKGTNEYGQLLLESDEGKLLTCDFKEIVFKI